MFSYHLSGLSWKEKVSHIFFCLGAVAVGAKDGACMHGKPLGTWQMEMPFPMAKRVFWIFVLLVFLMAAIVVAAILFAEPIEPLAGL